MHPALARLAAEIEDLSPRRASEAVDAFVEEHSVPLQDGRRVTFLYREKPEDPIEEVRLVHWIYALPSAQPFRRLEETSLWWLEMELPARSRVEYKLELVRGGAPELIRDPLNPRLARDPFGANSVLHGTGYRTPGWTRRRPEVPSGTWETLAVPSRAFGEARPVTVYVPARRRYTRRFPLLVVHDGEDYRRYAALGTVLDNLIERLEIPPLMAALTQSPDRLTEYAADPRHARFVAEEIPAELERHWPLEPDPGHRGLMGASFGAVAALASAWHQPGRFGRLLLQSGSFAFTDIGPHRREPVFDPVVEWMERFRREPGRPADKVFLSCGVFESLIYENRSLVPRLEQAGMEVRYREARDGHNWENWRDRLRTGLSWLFPGPLWLVYE